MKFHFFSIINRTSFYALSAFVLLLSSVYGDVIADYTFDQGAVVSTAARLDSVSVGQMTGSGGAAFSKASGMAYFKANQTADSLTAAISDEDYWQFTIEVADGHALDLSSLTLDHYASTTDTISFETNLSILVDKFSPDSVLGTSSYTMLINSNGTPSFGNHGKDGKDFTVELLEPRFQNMTGTLVFRIYAHDNRTDRQPINRLDNVRLNGKVVKIPEPNISALLFGVLGLIMVARRR
jgi:hypothetical protein